MVQNLLEKIYKLEIPTIKGPIEVNKKNVKSFFLLLELKLKEKNILLDLDDSLWDCFLGQKINGFSGYSFDISMIKNFSDGTDLFPLIRNNSFWSSLAMLRETIGAIFLEKSKAHAVIFFKKENTIYAITAHRYDDKFHREVFIICEKIKKIEKGHIGKRSFVGF